ncbi:MAG: YlxR family protein [Clostridia bacterium]
MKSKKTPLRMCLSCRTMKPKKELIRLVLMEDVVSIDLTGKKNGRGAYLCNDIQCFMKAKKAKSIERTFSVESNDMIYNDLEEYINRKG